MARLLTQDQQQRYRREGLVYPVPALSRPEVQQYRGACDELEARLGGRPRTVEVRQMHLHFRWAHELATHPRVLDAVEDLLGPDLLVWATELFAKHPEDATVSIGWHRDRPYMGFDPQTTTTAWIALSESMQRNGCMRAIPGPDRGTAPCDDRRAINVSLQPGEMSLHDAEIWHGSLPNRSTTKRVGFVVRFITPAAKPLSGQPPVILARGRASPDRFQIVDPPQQQSIEGAIAELKRSATLHLETMLATLEHTSS